MCMSTALTTHQGAEAPLERILTATGLRTQTQLADALGIRQSSISDAKRRNEGIPAGWLVTLQLEYNINPAWVLTGEGPRYLVPAGEEVAPPPVVPAVRGMPVAAQNMDAAADKILAAAKIMAETAGMFSENMQRAALGHSMAYTAEAFFDMADKYMAPVSQGQSAGEGACLS